MRRRSFISTIGASALSLSGCGASAKEATLWYSYGGKNREELLKLVDAFHVAHPEHRLRPVFQGDYFELLAKLRTAMHAGVTPTVTHVIGEVLPYMSRAGVLEPLDTLGIERNGTDVNHALSQWGAFEAPEGEPLWGLPFNRSTPIAFLNGKRMAELGAKAPETWDELRDVARKATGNDRMGFACPIDWWFWVALVGQAGGRLVENGEITLGGAAGVRALELWRTLIVDDRSMRPPPGRDYNAWQVVNTEFLEGRVAMIWTSTAFVRYLEDNVKGRFPIIAAPLPKDLKRSVPTGGTFFIVPKGLRDEHRSVASAFLRFMSEADSANQFATRTGYIPTSNAGLRKLEASGYYTAHGNDRVALTQLADVTPWPWLPELFRLQREIVQPRLERLGTESFDASAVIRDAVRAARESL